MFLFGAARSRFPWRTSGELEPELFTGSVRPGQEVVITPSTRTASAKIAGTSRDFLLVAGAALAVTGLSVMVGAAVSDPGIVEIGDCEGTRRCSRFETLGELAGNPGSSSVLAFPFGASLGLMGATWIAGALLGEWSHRIPWSLIALGPLIGAGAYVVLATPNW